MAGNALAIISIAACRLSILVTRLLIADLHRYRTKYGWPCAQRLQTHGLARRFKCALAKAFLRQGDGNGGAFGRPAVDRDVAAMQRHEFARQRKAQANALVVMS